MFRKKESCLCFSLPGFVRAWRWLISCLLTSQSKHLGINTIGTGEFLRREWRKGESNWKYRRKDASASISEKKFSSRWVTLIPRALSKAE